MKGKNTMLSNKKRGALIPLSLLIFTILIFILELLPNYVIESSPLLVISDFAQDAYDFIFPIAIFGTVFICSALFGMKVGIIKGILYSLISLVYYIPSGLLYALSSGYTVDEAIIVAFIQSAVFLMIMLVKAFVITLIAFIIVKASSKGRGALNLMVDRILEADPLNPKDCVSVALFSAPFVIFLYSLILEITNTVSFLMGYITSVRVNEIIYSVACYLFILGIFLCSLFLLRAISKEFIKMSKERKNETSAC